MQVILKQFSFWRKVTSNSEHPRAFFNVLLLPFSLLFTALCCLSLHAYPQSMFMNNLIPSNSFGILSGLNNSSASNAILNPSVIHLAPNGRRRHLSKGADITTAVDRVLSHFVYLRYPCPCSDKDFLYFQIKSIERHLRDGSLQNT